MIFRVLHWFDNFDNCIRFSNGIHKSDTTRTHLEIYPAAILTNFRKCQEQQRRCILCDTPRRSDAALSEICRIPKGSCHLSALLRCSSSLERYGYSFLVAPHTAEKWLRTRLGDISRWVLESMVQKERAPCQPSPFSKTGNSSLTTKHYLT